MFFYSEQIPSIVVPLHLTSSFNSLSFPSTCIGTSSLLSVYVSAAQLSGSTVEIVSVGDDSDQFDQTPLSFALTGGVTSQIIDITFTPTSWGLKTATVILSASNGSVINVSLEGMAAAVPLVLTSSVNSLSFGTTTVNTTSSMNVVVSAGGFTSVVETVTLSDNSNQFSFSPASIELTGSGTSKTVAVTYSPTITGSVTGTLTLSSSGGNTKNISLSGDTGVAATSVVFNRMAATNNWSPNYVTLNLTGAMAGDLLVVYASRTSQNQYNVPYCLVSSSAGSNWRNLADNKIAAASFNSYSGVLTTYWNCSGNNNGTVATSYYGEAFVDMKRLTATDLSGLVKVGCFQGNINYMVIRNVNSYDILKDSSGVAISKKLRPDGNSGNYSWPVTNTNITNSTQKLLIVGVISSGVASIPGVSDSSAYTSTKLFDVGAAQLTGSTVPFNLTRTATQVNNHYPFGSFVAIVIN
jgi:hypothetical protein